MSAAALQEIRVRLPRHLVEWLQEFSKAIAMTSDQLIANILEYYYEAWKVGYDEGRNLSSSEEETHLNTLNLDESLKAFLKTLSKAQRKSVNAILKRFIVWLHERSAPVSEASISEFLEQYKSGRNLKASTLSLYKNILRKFVKFYEKRVGQDIV
ncbi:MAG: phage integrase N-terminal SAM-like domain-containing protein [Candidatus Nezhaarchaeales archaeon]